MVLKPVRAGWGWGAWGHGGAEVLEEQLLQRQGFGEGRKQERKTPSVLLFHPWRLCCSLWLAWTRATLGSQTCPTRWEPESKELRDAGDQGRSPGTRGRADTPFRGKQSNRHKQTADVDSFSLLYNISS